MFAQISAGGSETVSSGGFDSGSAIGSGGVRFVSNLGVASGESVSSAGTMEIFSGATFAGVTFSAGAILRSSVRPSSTAAAGG